MGTIHPLSDNVINKIAAEEVIEKPMYILKELLDNALDASAQSITIKLLGYGLQSIEVIDDGIGMTKEDVKMAYRRHTTSKIFDETDLENIQSFGFRGEALASIASVCRISLSSRPADAIAGYRVVIENGEIIDERLVPMPQGTDVVVSHIFKSVPARRKFLRAEQTEYRQMISLIQTYALSNPTVRFQVFHNNKNMLTYPENQDTDLRIQSIIPATIVSALLPVTHEHEYISYSGFISHPQLSYKTTKQYYIYVNGRAITSSVISHAIKNAYGTLLAPLEYPYIVMFLEIPSHLIDVNVHPRKEEVKFIDTQAIFTAISDAIVKTLDAADMRYFDRRWQNDTDATQMQIRDGGTKTYAADTLRELVLGPVDDIKVGDLLQIHNLYILAQTGSGLILIDQHAAHERVLYEQFMQAYEQGLSHSNQWVFKKPVGVLLSASEALTLQEYEEKVRACGFEYEISEHKMRVTAVPDLMRDREIEPLIREMLELLPEIGAFSIDSFAQRMVTFLACRSAIKAGEPLTKSRIRTLLEELKSAKNQSTCPHGRPIRIEVDLKTLHSMFKR